MIFLRFYMEFRSLLFLKTKEKGNELLHLGPRVSVSSHGRPLAELDRTGEGRAAIFRRGSALGVRGKLGIRERGLSRTSGCPWFAGRRSEAAAPQAPADSGGTAPARRRSGGHGRRWLGLGAPLGRGEAVPEVNRSRGRAEVGARRWPRGGGDPASWWRRSGGRSKVRPGAGASERRRGASCGVVWGGGRLEG